MKQIKFEVGQTVQAINTEPLKGNDIAPPLTKGDKYTVQAVIFDKDGNPHLNVGLVSNYEYIRSYETGEKLPNGNLIHWCHPSRFELVEQ